MVDSDSRPFSPLLREIFDRMPAGVAVFDRELNLVEWNTSFADFLVQNQPDLAANLVPGASLASVSPWPLADATRMFRRALAGETVTLDGTVHDGPSGRTYWDIVLSPLYEGGEVVGVLDTTTDATRRVTVARDAEDREGLFRLVFDSTSDAVILNDFDTGHVAEANEAAARMHGYTRQEFVGIDPVKFIHPDSLALLAKYQENVRRGEDFRSRAQDVRKDGSVFDVEVMGTALDFQGKKYLAAVVRDISDQVAAERERMRAQEVLREAQTNLEQRVKERTQELASLLDVSRAVLSTLDLDSIFQRVQDEVAKVIPYSGCSVLILDGDFLEVIVTRSYVSPDLAARARGARLRVAVAPSIWNKILAGTAVIIDDSLSDSEEAIAWRRLTGNREEANLNRIRSWLIVPLIHQTEVLGVLSISRAGVAQFDDSHAQLASAFAAQVTVAVANARLYQQSIRRAREMEGLASIAGALTVGMPTDQALEVLASRVLAASSGVACSLTMYGDDGEYQGAGAAGLPRHFVEGMLRAITVFGAPSITQIAASQAQRQILRDTRRKTLADPRFELVHEYLKTAPWDTAVITPVISRGKVLGTLEAYYPETAEPDAEELRLLAATADQVAIGMENSRLVEELRRRVFEMDALYRADERFHRSLVLDEVLQALADSAIEVMGADRSAALIFEDAPPHRFSIRAVAGLEPQDIAELAQALKSLDTDGVRSLDGPRIVPDTSKDTPAMRDVTKATKVASQVDVPIHIADKRFGFFSMGWMQPHYITESEVRLATGLGQQAAVAIENARLYERSQVAASLEERQRLARELHDSVSQALYGIALGTKTAHALIERDPRKAVEPLDYVGSLAEAGLAELRALIFELRPESLATEGLVAALDKQVSAMRARHGITVDANLSLEPDLRLDYKEVLYRVAQEALHNTVKHARANRVSVELVRVDDKIRIRIADDGIGFDTSGEFPGHLGLRSMAERTARVGGQLSIESSPGSGTTITVNVPAEPGHLPGVPGLS
ncbi:MAG: GAF domain-containing protein [Dehalococcoidia bacterium]